MGMNKQHPEYPKYIEKCQALYGAYRAFES